MFYKINNNNLGMPGVISTYGVKETLLALKIKVRRNSKEVDKLKELGFLEIDKIYHKFPKRSR
jgi:hypothetical protein